MVGIDIVDHSDPKLRPRGERAFRLITHPDDQHHTIDISLDKLFWLYWAAKEAVYKTNRALIRFDPKSIAVTIRPSDNNYMIQSGSISGEIDQNEKYTLCVCAKIPLDNTTHKIFHFTAIDQSATIRSLMVTSILQKKGIHGSVSRDQYGLPVFLDGTQAHPTTFTHHHGYLGYICTI